MIAETSFEINTEMQRFQQELKHFSDTVVTSINKLGSECRSMLEQNGEIRKKLENREAQLQFKLVDKTKALSALQSRVKDLEVQRTKLEANSKSIPDDIANMKMKSEKIREDLQKLEAEIESAKRIEETDAKSVREQCELFRKRTGMEIMKLDHGAIQINFQQIDKEKPEKLFSFQIKLDADRKYVVPMCNPSIQNLDKYLEELNNPGNEKKVGIFAWFIQKMRREFQKYVTEMKKGIEEEEAKARSNVSYIL
eukprot:jgi/Bigna1/137322/aug1.38_g12030